MEANHLEWKVIVKEMDERNASTLRWGIKLLCGILVALLGYIGSQAYERLYADVEATVSSAPYHLKHPKPHLPTEDPGFE